MGTFPIHLPHQEVGHTHHCYKWLLFHHPASHRFSHILDLGRINLQCTGMVPVDKAFHMARVHRFQMLLLEFLDLNLVMERQLLWGRNRRLAHKAFHIMGVGTHHSSTLGMLVTATMERHREGVGIIKKDPIIR
jgi:hypothetical protein